MGISNDAQEDVDEFGAASAELKQFPWDQKFIASASHAINFWSHGPEVYCMGSRSKI